MRGDVGGHAHGNAAGAVYQQVREAAGQHGGLHQRFVKVWVKIDRVLIDLAQQVHGKLGHARLGITHGSRAVAIDRAKVALPLYQKVADGEILRKAHHRIIHAAVAMGVVFAQHIAHQAGAFAVGFIGRHAQLAHCIQDAAVHGL